MTEFNKDEKNNIDPNNNRHPDEMLYGYQHFYFAEQDKKYDQQNLNVQGQQHLSEQQNLNFQNREDGKEYSSIDLNSTGQQPNPYMQNALNGNFASPLNSRAKFWRVWPLSFIFMIFHVFVLNIFALILSVVFILHSDFSFQDPNAWLETLLNSKMQNYASILMALVCIPVYLLYLKRRNRKYQNSFVREPLRPKSFFGMIVGAFGALGLVTVAMILLEYMGRFVPLISQFFEEYEELVGIVVSNDESIILQIIGTAILVPIAEELLFRGIVLGELNLRYSPKVAVVLQALLFGLFHMNPIQSFYTIIPGLFLGIAYYKTKNIIVPIIGHMIFNFLGGILSVFAGDEILNILNYLQLFFGIFTFVIIIQFFIPKYVFTQAIGLYKVEKNVASK